MYIVYSALRDINEDASQTRLNKPKITGINLRLQGYLAACAKYNSEIIAIQQYIPGWVPNPPDSLSGDF